MPCFEDLHGNNSDVTQYRAQEPAGSYNEDLFHVNAPKPRYRSHQREAVKGGLHRRAANYTSIDEKVIRFL
jgi:hypothetical protein